MTELQLQKTLLVFAYWVSRQLLRSSRMAGSCQRSLRSIHNTAIFLPIRSSFCGYCVPRTESGWKLRHAVLGPGKQHSIIYIHRYTEVDQYTHINRNSCALNQYTCAYIVYTVFQSIKKKKNIEILAFLMSTHDCAYFVYQT